jgi:hypothetical protein
MKKLSPQEEFSNLISIVENESQDKILNNLKESFNTLYTRSQVLLSLTTICLTITGFIGPKIASTGQCSKFFIIFGLVFVILSTVILFTGPLYIQWISQYKADSFEETVIYQIKRRNKRTIKYRIAKLFLAIGLTGYVISVISYLTQM